MVCDDREIKFTVSIKPHLEDEADLFFNSEIIILTFLSCEIKQFQLKLYLQ